MALWLRARLHHAKLQHQEAFACHQQAFELAKHSIGQHTNLLVDHFAESCAKDDQWREFKKLIEWAQYKSIPIRFMRGLSHFSPEEAAKTAFTLMQKASLV